MSKKKFPEVKVRMIPEQYVTLPWKKLSNTYDVLAGRAKRKGLVLDSGTVDIPMSLLYQLAEQDVWDSQFGSAFIELDTKQGWAVEQAGFGVQETRGGHHRTDKLIEFLDSLTD